MMDAKTAPDPLVLANAIATGYIVNAAQLPAPMLYTASAFTIGAAGDTFTLPSTVTNYGVAEYEGELHIQLVSTGLYLNKRTHDEMDALRSGQTAVFQTVPEHYEVWWDRSSVMQGRCYPGAKVAEACNLFRAMVLDDPRDFTATDLDTVTLDLGRYGIQGLEAYVSAMMLAAMHPSEADLRKLDKSVASLWFKEAETCLYEEGCRLNALDAAGRTQRWAG